VLDSITANEGNTRFTWIYPRFCT